MKGARLLAILSFFAGAAILAWYLGMQRLGEPVSSHPLAPEASHFATESFLIQSDSAEVELALAVQWHLVFETRAALGRPAFVVVDENGSVVLEGTALLERTQASPGRTTEYFALGQLASDPQRQYRLTAKVAQDLIPDGVRLFLEIREPGMPVTPLVLVGAGLFGIGLVALPITRPE